MEKNRKFFKISQKKPHLAWPNRKRESIEIPRDFDADEEHSHNIGDDDGGDSKRSEGDTNAVSTVAIEGEIHEDDANAAEQEHETRGETLDDVLAVDTARQEDDGADGAGRGVLGAADARGLDDDIVDEAGDDAEVGEEDEGEDGGGRWQGEVGRELQASAGRAEEAIGHNAEDREEGIHGERDRRCGGAQALIFFFDRYFDIFLLNNNNNNVDLILIY